MVAMQMSASLFAFVLVVLIQGDSEALPVRDFDGVPSGDLYPISGAVPVSVSRSNLGKVSKLLFENIPNEILKELRNRVDKNYVSELDSSVRDDIFQDTLAPPECIDTYGVRDGALKHMLRGIRDVGGALVKDFQALGQGVLKDLPLVPNVVNGVGEAVTYVLCGVEDALSDIVSGAFDEGNDILTKVVVNVLEFDGSAPLANVPAGIKNITELAVKVASKIADDIVLGIEKGVEDLAAEVASGVQDVVNDVEGVVRGVETGVTNVVNDVGGVVSGVETDVTSVVNAVKTGVQRIGGGVGSGVGNIVPGLKSGLGGVIDAL